MYLALKKPLKDMFKLTFPVALYSVIHLLPLENVIQEF